MPSQHRRDLRGSVLVWASGETGCGAGARLVFGELVRGWSVVCVCVCLPALAGEAVEDAGEAFEAITRKKIKKCNLQKMC